MCRSLPKLEDIKKYIESYDIVLNTIVYNKSTEKLDLTCIKGHNFFMTFNTFKKGHRCAECKGIKKHSYEYIKSEIEKDGSTLLSKEYKNAHTKLDIQCPNNHIYSLKWNHLYIGHRCHTCFTDKHTGKNHSRYNPDRTRRRRSHLLSFNLKNINIISDDPNFNNYLEEQTKDTKNLYDVDHIFPRTAFIDNNLDLIYDIKIIKEICNSRDNLRIINNKENKSKSSKYNQQEFLVWFNQKLESI